MNSERNILSAGLFKTGQMVSPIALMLEALV
jgi:hypothetical protein